MSRPRILLVDDHRLFIDGLRRLLEPELEIVGTLDSGEALQEAVITLRPDVVLLDISMPLRNGFDAARQLRQLGERCKLIFVTMHEDPDYVREAFRVGASGYVLKRGAGDELLHAIRQVLQGDVYVTPLVPQGMLTARALADCSGLETPQLTARQRQVLQLIAEGHAGKSMASHLGVSLKTIEYHKACIMKQLGLHTTAELTRYAINHGLVSRD